MKSASIDKEIHYSASEILAQLDSCANDFIFPMLDNGYVYPITTKLSSFRDEKRWAMIIEVFGFNPRGGITHSISNCLHIYGNCLNFTSGTHADNHLFPIRPSTEGSFADADYGLWLNPAIENVVLRDRDFAIEHHRQFYIDRGIQLKNENKIYIQEFLRGLLPEYNRELLATEFEIRDRIPRDLPQFKVLNHWNHPNCAAGQFPSESETFILLSKALASGNKEIYAPTLEPNSHWSNWPHAGSL